MWASHHHGVLAAAGAAGLAGVLATLLARRPMTPPVSGIAAARVWGGLTVAAGAATLVLAFRRRAPDAPDVPRIVVAALGARQVVQGGLVLLAPTADMVKLAIGVEILHGSSMVPVAMWARYRRPALLAAGQAALFASAGGAVLSTLRG